MNNIKLRLNLIAGVLLALVVYPVQGAIETIKKPARVISTLVKTTSLVEAVNKKTRELKLIDAGGRRFTVAVDESVRNFDQIEPRDRVIIEYLESVAIIVAPAGSEPLIGDVAALQVAEAGDKPGMFVGKTQVITATVVSLNRADRLATLELKSGEFRTVKVGANARLDLVDVGNQVRLRVTRALAIRVEKPKN